MTIRELIDMETATMVYRSMNNEAFHSFHFIIFTQVKGSYIDMFFNLTCFKRLK